ncbi:MAG: VOC family protein [Proteobacteria bacterium]|nr:VOC family protein [Pseudomonadota bacterium]
MIRLDHLSIIAPTLESGVGHVRQCLGVDIPYGRTHGSMGTHNHLLHLGDDIYLEVIAVDPGAPPPAHRRWFGLDDAEKVKRDWDDGFRLRGWVARTSAIDSLIDAHGDLLGRKMALSGGAGAFFFGVPSDGSLPLDGIAPSVIDRGGRLASLPPAAELGTRLHAFVIEHPDPDYVSAVYDRLGIANPPKVEHGARLRYRAEIETPWGMRTLS